MNQSDKRIKTTRERYGADVFKKAGAANKSERYFAKLKRENPEKFLEISKKHKKRLDA